MHTWIPLVSWLLSLNKSLIHVLIGFQGNNKALMSLWKLSLLTIFISADPQASQNYGLFWSGKSKLMNN